MADALIPLLGAPVTHPPGAAPGPQANLDAAKRAAAEFESVFLTEMLQPMFEGIGTDGLGEGGDGEQMFRPMLIEQYAAAIAKSGGVGLAHQILGELTRLQAGQTPAPEAESGDGADR